jgi:hypothetical protein
MEDFIEAFRKRIDVELAYAKNLAAVSKALDKYIQSHARESCFLPTVSSPIAASAAGFRRASFKAKTHVSSEEGTVDENAFSELFFGASKSILENRRGADTAAFSVHAVGLLRYLSLFVNFCLQANSFNS